MGGSPQQLSKKGQVDQLYQALLSLGLSHMEPLFRVLVCFKEQIILSKSTVPGSTFLEIPCLHRCTKGCFGGVRLNHFAPKEV
jgi:hypothetical protein